MSNDKDESDDEIFSTPPELRATAQTLNNELLPIKSRERYKQTYITFKQWQETKKVKIMSENVLIAYFSEMSQNLSPLTLWSIYSMLECTIATIAAYLNLPHPSLYTAHSFRRTSATLLADSGADITTLKRHGGWKSTTVTEGYIDDSINYKRKIGNQIASVVNMPPSNLLENNSATKIHNQTASNKIPSAALSNSHTMTSIEVSESESHSEFVPTQPKRSKVEEKNKSEESCMKEAKVVYNMHNCTVRFN